MIKLGDKVKDSLTGYEGAAVSRTDFLHGCSRIGVQSSELKDGKPVDAQWFDEQQLVLIEGGWYEKQTREPSAVKTGGPGPNPPSRDYKGR